MDTPFIKVCCIYRQEGDFGLIDVFSCKALVNNPIRKGFLHHFDAEAMGTPSIPKKTRQFFSS
jgi:hypothetical protein